ncbi:PREDICTED: WD repeat-containing protein 87 [Ipomoea nil]|uniref:WD repeat-containing protein 87 n=1 Tax=Ipomoea nil TaxID=35883 RepID=UPI00090136C7|nr:PREDICTED: WD repeat-containing protein 87 [Ipomoea nil]
MAVAKGEMEQQNKQSLSELMFSEPMKKATKLLVSVSLFSVIVSYMSWRNSHPLLAFPIQVLSLALDKNYMFLVCNGILVLLAKTSGRLVLRSGPAVFDDLIHGDDVHSPPPHAKLLDSLLHKEAAMESRLLLLQNAYSDVLEEEEEEEEKHVIIEEEEEEREDEDSRSLMIVGDKEEMEGDDHDHEELEELNNNEVFTEAAEKEVAEERERLNKLSPEELNKKFEEFIRKMKEDIRIEAQQHLVLVK